MAEHTPGPWKLCKGRNAHYRDKIPGMDYEATMQQCFFLAADGDFVADIIVAVNNGGLANAALLAAAPELLEACKQVIGFCTNARQTWPDWKDYPDVGRLFGIVTAANAKATPPA